MANKKPIVLVTGGLSEIPAGDALDLSGNVLNQAKGANIASASTINLTTATGNLVHVTGTTTINTVTLGSGMTRTVVFDGALTLNYHATDHILPNGAASIVTVAGDIAVYHGDGSTVRCVQFIRGLGVRSSDLSDFAHDASGAYTSFWYGAGRIRGPSGAAVVVPAGSIGSFGSNLYYIEVDVAGTVSKNTTGFTTGSFPIAEVQTVSTVITSITDKRGFATAGFAALAGSSSQAFAASDLTCTSLNGGQMAGFHNMFINGNPIVAQRGTSFAAPASSTYTLDRWRYQFTSAAVVTVSQEASVVPTGFSHSIKYLITTTDTTVDAGDFIRAGQHIEGYTAARAKFGTSSAKTTTLSFQVYSSKTGTFCVCINNSASTRSYVAEYTINAANTWETKTIAIPGDTSGTWLNTTGIGIRVHWTLVCGSTFQTTANTWAAGNYFGTSNQVNWANDASATFYLADVDFRVGSFSTKPASENRPYSVEEQLCRWYGQPLHSSVYLSIGVKYATAYIDSIIYFQAMRAAPTLTNPSGTAVTWNAGVAGDNQASAYDGVAAAYTTITGALTVTLNTAAVNSAMLRYNAATSFSGGVTSVIVGLGVTNPYFLSAEI